MGMPQAIGWTAARVRALPDDGKRYEVVDGELLVTPSPVTRHQRALRELFEPIADYVKRERLGEVLWSPADIEFDPLSLVQPDLFVLPFVEGRQVREWSEVETLLLAIEVISPSTARYDRLTKRLLYQRQGIEYWMVDLDARVVERWRPEDQRPEILAERLEWHPAADRPPLVIELEPLFERVWG